MRVSRFLGDHGPETGVLDDEGGLHPIGEGVGRLALSEFLNLSLGHRLAVCTVALSQPAHVQIGAVAPVALAAPDATVWAIALNYDSHISEGGHPRPSHPMLFLRQPSSLSNSGEPIYKPRRSQQFDYEGELAVFIGRGGYQIDVGAAMDHIAGYACCNEGSVREWQRHTTQITPGKTFWKSGAIGPALRLRDGVFDPLASRLQTRVNGATVQSARVGEMLFSIGEVIAYVSEISPLCPGDILLMGTPGGVGLRRNPPTFLEPGDEVEVEIDGLGVLRNVVVQG